MRKWISIMVMLAMVVTTAMPSASHASMNAHQQTEHSKTASAHDHANCDHDGEKVSHNKQPHNEKPCCDQGVCKCLGGNCHGGLTSILGKDSDSLLAFDDGAAQFAVADQHIESATLARLKRPPKA